MNSIQSPKPTPLGRIVVLAGLTAAGVEYYAYTSHSPPMGLILGPIMAFCFIFLLGVVGNAVTNPNPPKLLKFGIPMFFVALALIKLSVFLLYKK